MKNYNEIFENKTEVADQLQQQKSQEIINEKTKSFSKCESKQEENADKNQYLKSEQIKNETKNNTKVLSKCESNYQEFADKNQQFKLQKITKETNDNTKAFSKCETTNSNNHYFRITGYCPEHDFSFIIDSNGMFEKLWQFSSYLISKGLKILEVSTAEKFLDINITPTEEDAQHLILRATADGKPEYVEQAINGIKCTVIKVSDKIYNHKKQMV